MKTTVITLFFCAMSFTMFSQGKYFGGIGDGYASAEISNITLSLDDFDQDVTELKLYPNPVTKVLNIFSPNIVWEKYLIIEIDGKIVTKSKMEETTIHVEKLKPGTYFLKLINEQNSTVFKFIKL